MNKEKFIDVLRQVVIDDSISSVESLLANPPGRSPSAELKQMSLWFNSLETDDKRKVSDIIRKSVEVSIFGFLCVLDGVRAIEDGSEKGELKLVYENEKTGENIQLNDKDSDYLHDLL
jgi:hypothetical protein